MSGPGDRAPKLPSSREPTQFLDGEGQDAAPTRVGVAAADPPESDEFGTFRQPHARKPGDLDAASSVMVSEKQPREGDEPQSAGESVEKSDAGVVPEKPAKTWVTPVESVEGRPSAKGKSAARNARSTQREESALTALQQIGQRAKNASLSVDPRWEPGAGNPLAGFCPGGGPKGPSLPERQEGQSQSFLVGR